MSLSTVINRVSYAGNGSTTAFSFPYYFLADGDLKVILVTDLTGVEVVQTITTEYAITGAGVAAGGTVTMVTAPATGKTLVIYRDPALTQGTDLVENDAMPAESLEQSYDRLTMIAQRTRELTERSMVLPDGFTATFDLTLPVDLATADTVIAVNPGADGFVVGPTITAIADAATKAAAAAVSAAAAAASATAAGVSETAAAASETAAGASETSAAASAALATASMPYRDVVYVTNADSPLTIVAADAGKVYSCDASSGAITINLPSIALVTSTAKMFVFVKTDSSVNKITLARNGSDTIIGAASLLIESQNSSATLIADIGGSPDDWAALQAGSGGGAGGGGGTLTGFTDTNAPIEEVQSGFSVLTFEEALSQDYNYTFQVPDGYVAGTQINLRVKFFPGGVPGGGDTVLFSGVATLIADGDSPTSTTNQHSSTNSAVATVSTGIYAGTIDLTDSSGEINSVAVAANDMLKITVSRGTDALTEDAYLIKGGEFVDLS